VRGPLLSLTASGRFAKKALIFTTSGELLVAKTGKFDKRKTTARQAAYYVAMKKAHKIWNELPQYMRDRWLTTSQNLPGVNSLSHNRAPLKGRLLFLHTAFQFVQRGSRAQALPYHPEPAPEILDYGAVFYAFL